MAQGDFVAYYRVSTARQGASGLGLEAQRKAVADYLSGGSWRIVQEHTEIESGRKAGRPELQKAIAAARLYRVPLVVAKLDRLSRNIGFLCALRDSGVKVVFADMPDANEFTINVMASLAEWEAKMISRRTRDALAASKARGTKLGGKRDGGRLTDEGRTAGSEANRQRAAERAGELRALLEDLRASGVMTLSGMAMALTERGVPTARGGTTWQAVQVGRAMKAAGLAA